MDCCAVCSCRGLLGALLRSLDTCFWSDASSFLGIYGLLRKQVNLPAAPGLLVECCFLLPLVLVFVVFFDFSLEFRSEDQFALLMLGGVITVALIFFTAATIRLPLVILGVISM